MTANSHHQQSNTSPWKPVVGLFGARRPPPHLARWLLNRGSLTDSLRRLYGNALSLHLEGQRWRRPGINEARLLTINPHHRCLERRVVLLNGATPVVMARSLIPFSSLVGRNRRLACLGTRPLGAALFADPSVRRRVLELAWLKTGQELFPNLPHPAWARRSVFEVTERPLLVYEAFLSPLSKVENPASPLPQQAAA